MRLTFASVQAGHGEEAAETGLDLLCELARKAEVTLARLLTRLQVVCPE
jgi:hypothetical protein